MGNAIIKSKAPNIPPAETEFFFLIGIASILHFGHNCFPDECNSKPHDGQAFAVSDISFLHSGQVIKAIFPPYGICLCASALYFAIEENYCQTFAPGVSIGDRHDGQVQDGGEKAASRRVSAVFGHSFDA